ncbi:leucine-rich repeat domain-containing protein [Peribacillus glennii]|uniref:Leucine-rich repeat domain-containing protein n=1 Tax=Peribacillus glennii TaxID=2303991 RepID=A0A372L988_9BACI|nr:leucine-rich repeat domain-containing protein [Peribacillus glennii]RFU61099.1 hypothetical protein D0466_19130 [Peribacillus glennii]
MMKRLLAMLAFAMLVFFSPGETPSISAKGLSSQEIIKKSRIQVDLRDKDGKIHKAYLYSEKETKGYKTQNKKKYTVYHGSYKLALFDKDNKKKLSEINTGIKTFSSSMNVTDTGTIKIFPYKAGQPNLVGITEELIPPAKKVYAFHSLYYVNKGKLSKVKVQVDKEPMYFYNFDKLTNNKPNEFVGSSRFKDTQHDGTFIFNWLFKPASSELDVTSAKFVRKDGVQENMPIFSYIKDIRFKDKGLESAVRDTLKKPSGTITLTDLDKITAISAKYHGITDLSGLEYARNLEKLDVSYNGLDEKDFWPIEQNPKLQYLDIESNYGIRNLGFIERMWGELSFLNIGSTRVNDLSPLEDAKSLKELYLYGTEIKNLRPISNLRSLTYLDISATDVSELEPIKGLKTLETLWMERINIDSFQALKGLTKLKKLNIDNTFYGTDDRIDGSPLKNLKQLELLYMDRVFFKDFTFLKSMSNLKTLKAPYSHVSAADVRFNTSLEHLDIKSKDVSGLSNLTKLRYLDISDSGTENIDALSNLKNLTELNASNNEIQDIAPISSLPKLERLALDNNQIKRLPQFSLPHLSLLGLSENDFSDLTPLTVLTQLQELDLGYVEFEPGSLSALSSLEALERLGLSASRITSIEPLSKLVHISQLDLSNNKIEDIKPIAALPKLENLDVSLNSIQSLPELNLPNLTALSVSGNEIVDITQIGALKKLNDLQLENNPIRDYSPLKQLPGLEMEYPENEDEIIKDSLLEQAIREELNKPQGGITKEDLSKLKSLEIYQSEVRSLKGLEYATNLTNLQIFDTWVSDIEPLKGMKHVKTLNLGFNKIKNIEPLSELAGIEELNLEHNRIEQVDSLANLTRLRDLNLGHNRVTKIEALSDLNALENLELRNNRIIHAALSSMDKLKSLNLMDNDIKEISLENVTSLEDLSLDQNPIESVSFLRNLDRLRSISFIDTPVRDITVLTGLENLISASFDMDIVPWEDATVNTLLERGVELRINGIFYVNGE